jgi:hypothetical protein
MHRFPTVIDTDTTFHMQVIDSHLTGAKITHRRGNLDGFATPLPRMNISWAGLSRGSILQESKIFGF